MPKFGSLLDQRHDTPSPKTESCHDVIFVITAAMEVVIMITSVATSDVEVGMMTTLEFQWAFISIWVQFCMYMYLYDLSLDK